MNTLTSQDILQMVQDYELGQNVVVLENGTCIVVKSSTLSPAMDETTKILSQFKPGNIDFKATKLDKEISMSHYNIDNVFNFVKISDCDNKSNTYLAIIGRNGLIKDLNSPKMVYFISNGNVVNNYEYKLSLFRE